jgi:excisionase family DNA binding protein
MRAELQPVLKAAKELPADELPQLLGELEEVRCTALARLSSPPAQAQPNDEWLTVEEAACQYKLSCSYFYHHGALPFVKRMGRRVLVSRPLLEKHLKMA